MRTLPRYTHARADADTQVTQRRVAHRQRQSQQLSVPRAPDRYELAVTKPWLSSLRCAA
jgi:hypothetical protein